MEEKKEPKFEYKTITLEKFYSAIQPNITTTVSGVQYFNSSSTEEDNAMFQKMQDLYKMSSVHSYFVNLKASLIRGSGIFPEDENDSRTKEFLSKKNRAGQNLYDIWDKSCSDMALYESACQQVIYDSEREIAEVYHTSPVKIRAGCENDLGGIDNYYFSSTWGEVSNVTDKHKFNDVKNAKLIPAFGTSTGNTNELIYTKKNSPLNETYSFPQYLSAENFMHLEYNLSDYINNKLSGGYYPSGIFYMNSNLSPEQQDQFTRDFRRKHQGVKNSGKIIFVFGDTSQSKPEFLKLTDELGNSLFKDFIQTAQQQIALAHGGSTTILGVTKEGNDLGGEENRLALARTVFLEDVIKAYQSALINSFNEILSVNKLGRVTVMNNSLKLQQPIADVNDLTIDERREMIYGLPPMVQEPTNEIIEDKPPVL